MSKTTVTRMTSTRIPTAHGTFQLCYYTNTVDKKEHLAFTMGEVAEADNPVCKPPVCNAELCAKLGWQHHHAQW